MTFHVTVGRNTISIPEGRLRIESASQIEVIFNASLGQSHEEIDIGHEGIADSRSQISSCTE